MTVIYWAGLGTELTTTQFELEKAMQGLQRKKCFFLRISCKKCQNELDSFQIQDFPKINWTIP